MNQNFSFTIGKFPVQNFKIVRSTNALDGEIDTINTLVHFIDAVTGHSLPVICDNETAEFEIVVGKTNRDTKEIEEARQKIRHDGFSALVKDKKFYITATTSRGCVFGLYWFMEEYLGVRFYSSTYTTIIKNAAVSVPCDLYRVCNPSFMARDPYWYDLLSPKNTAFANFRYALRSNQRDMDDVGGGISYTGGFVHTLSQLAELPHKIGLQPCLTDEKVYQTVLKNLRKLLKENPNASIVSVSQNDSYAHQLGCQCENCKAIDDREGTPMGSLLTFVNRIANEIRDEYPNVFIDTLAYRYTRKPPKTLRPESNVIIRLCSIECCSSHPLTDDSCQSNREFCEDIQNWAKICDHIYVWDYVTDFRHYLAPFPNFKVLRENIQFFAKNHVIGLFSQGNYESISGEFGELRTYLLSKLMWNADMSEQEYYKLIDEFLENYYGDGWRFIKEYIDATCELAAQNHLKIYDRPDSFLPFTNDEFCPKMLSLWDKALAAAQNEEYRNHVEQSRIQVLYYSSFAEDLPDNKQRLLEMHKAIKKFGITRHREGAVVPETIDQNDPQNLH